MVQTIQQYLLKAWSFILAHKVTFAVLALVIVSYVAGRIHATHRNSVECAESGIILDPLDFSKAKSQE